MFAQRRQKLFDEIEGGVAIFPASKESLRNSDVHYPFRQQSSFFYVTGFEEPDAIAVLRNIKGKKEYLLFVRPRDPEKEIWTGYRAGVEGAVNRLGADRAYAIEDFSKKWKEVFEGAEKIYFSLLKGFDSEVLPLIDEHRRSLGRTGKGIPDIIDAEGLISEMRIRKSPEEITTLKVACELSAKAHSLAMAYTRPGLNEAQIEALVEFVFKNEGAKRMGYGSIVASGHNATVLHYVDNDRFMKEGELLLIDAGGEFGYYSADITRTYPVSGKFTKEQEAIYSLVLSVQKACIAMAKPGATLRGIHETAVELLVEGMLSLGLLTGSKKEIIQSRSYRRFYPHGTGHLLGMDVHDVGLYEIKGEARPLEPGMVFTVEPGFYVQPYDQDAPAAYRGIGVRIEDDILVTETGNEVLTRGVPKEIEQMQALIGTRDWPNF